MIKRGDNTVYCGIYKITAPTGCEYVGQSRDIIFRWQVYNREEFRSMGPKLANSIRTYGIDLHTFELVEECCEDDLDNRERYYIKYWQTKEFGLNMTTGGNGAFRHSEETKYAMSIAKKGKPSPLRGRIRNYRGFSSPLKGKKRTMQSRLKQSATMTGAEKKGIKICNTKTNEEWISASQCSRHYGVTSPTIHNWVKINKNNLILM